MASLFLFSADLRQAVHITTKAPFGGAFVCGRHRELLLRELVLTYAAEGALEIVGQVLKCCAGLDASFGKSLGGIIFPTAEVANILFHCSFCVLEVCIRVN